MKNRKLVLPDRTTLLSLEKGFKPCSMRSWSRDIKKLYGGCCVVSNLSTAETSIVSHHLYSKKDYASLEFSLLNGVPLAKEIHRDFHKKFGQKVTAKAFIQYLELLYRSDNSLDVANLHTLIDWIRFLDSSLLFL
jgi:hypothetical protein